MTAIGDVSGGMGAGGIAAVTARMDAIRARLGSLAAPPATPTLVGQTGTPAFDLASASATAAPTGTGAPAAATVDRAGRSSAVSGLASDGGSTTSAWAAKLPAAGQKWAGAIEDAAEAAGVEPALLAALVQAESGFDQDAVSHAGARGLTQLMPGTADALGVDPHDPLDNLAGGARYIAEQLDRFGSVELALAAYNAGPGRVSQAGGIPRIPETMAYVDKVVATWKQLR